MAYLEVRSPAYTPTCTPSGKYSQSVARSRRSRAAGAFSLDELVHNLISHIRAPHKLFSNALTSTYRRPWQQGVSEIA